jgi:hypothetical protein
MEPGAGPGVQLRLGKKLSFEEYVTTKAWELATLDACPLCEPARGCQPERLAPYMRKVPAVAYVARFWCAFQRVSISLLPDFYQSRRPGLLADVEEAVARVEKASSVAKAADKIRPGDIEEAVTLDSAIRWVRRQRDAVYGVLFAVVAMFPAVFANCRVTVAAIRARLGADCALVVMRAQFEPHLHALPAPLGLNPAPIGRRVREGWFGHSHFRQLPGPDPPRKTG